MATTPGNVDGEYGISKTLAGFTIESVTVTEEPQLEKVPDQKNRVAKELHYDTLYNLNMTVRGASKPSADAGLTYDGQKYIIDSVEDAGTYNGLRRFNIKGHRYTNCNTATPVS